MVWSQKMINKQRGTIFAPNIQILYIFMYNVRCVQYKICVLCSVHDSLYTITFSVHTPYIYKFTNMLFLYRKMIIMNIYHVKMIGRSKMHAR